MVAILYGTDNKPPGSPGKEFLASSLLHRQIQSQLDEIDMPSPRGSDMKPLPFSDNSPLWTAASSTPDHTSRPHTKSHSVYLLVAHVGDCRAVLSDNGVSDLIKHSLNDFLIVTIINDYFINHY